MATLIAENLPTDYEISSIMDLLSISDADLHSHKKEPGVAHFIFRDIELARKVQEAHQGEFFSGQTLFILVAECDEIPKDEPELIILSDKEEEIEETRAPSPLLAKEEEETSALLSQPKQSTASEKPVFDEDFAMNLKNISLPAKAGFHEDDPFNLLLDTKIYSGLVFLTLGFLMMSSFF